MTKIYGRDLERAHYAQEDIATGKYVKPVSVMIGSNEKKLYALEERRNAILHQCAEEWARIMGVDKKEYWTRSLPQALHDTLETFSAAPGIIVAEAYLERYGYTITRPVFEGTKQGEAKEKA